MSSILKSLHGNGGNQNYWSSEAPLLVISGSKGWWGSDAVCSSSQSWSTATRREQELLLPQALPWSSSQPLHPKCRESMETFQEIQGFGWEIGTKKKIKLVSKENTRSFLSLKDK